MNITRASRGQALDNTLVALADPTRRAILRRLGRQEARVTDLAAPFAISLNSVSKHIRILERARLVSRRRVGREHILRFRAEPLAQVSAWIAGQERFWRAGLEAMDAHLTESARRKETAR